MASLAGRVDFGVHLGQPCTVVSVCALQLARRVQLLRVDAIFSIVQAVSLLAWEEPGDILQALHRRSDCAFWHAPVHIQVERVGRHLCLLHTS